VSKDAAKKYPSKGVIFLLYWESQGRGGGVKRTAKSDPETSIHDMKEKIDLRGGETYGTHTCPWQFRKKRNRIATVLESEKRKAKREKGYMLRANQVQTNLLCGFMDAQKRSSPSEGWNSQT